MTDSTMTLRTRFSNAVCINLDRRPDRWREMRIKLDQAGLSHVRRQSAIDARTLAPSGVPGALLPAQNACKLSHVAAVRAARDNGAEHITIFEDDAFFTPDLDARFAQAMSELPQDWEMLYLGAYHLSRPLPVSSHIVRATEAVTTHAYVVRQTIFDRFITFNETCAEAVDCCNVQLQAERPCYCIEPNLVGQEAGYSDVMGASMPEKPLVYTFPIQGNW